jgi:soluble lytic murein transglycosylase-like protein
MSKAVVMMLLVLAAPLAVRAQTTLKPPLRPPVPMSLEDQERARKEESLHRQAADAAATPAASPLKVPVASTSRHISTGNVAFDSIIYEASTQNGLDPCLIVSVMRAESGFNRMAVSPKGASGLMQLMPATAERFGVKNIFDPRENILAGARYLRWLLDRFSGDVRLALAGYNAGEGAVEFYGNRIPPFLETQNYVRAIYMRYSGLHLGTATGQPTAAATHPVTPTPSAAEPPKADANPSYNQIIRFTSTSGDAAKSGN